MTKKYHSRPVLVCVLSLFTLLAGGFAIATTSGVNEIKSTYFLQTKISIDGKLIGTPQIRTKVGEDIAVVIHDDQQKDMLKMQMVVTDVTMPKRPQAVGISTRLKFYEGDRVSEASSQILLLPGQEGSITMGVDGHTYELVILAVKE